MRARQPLALAGHSRQPLFLGQPGSDSLERHSISWLAAPILGEGEPLGLWCVDQVFADGVPPERDLEFLGELAGLAAQVVGLDRGFRARQAALRRRNRVLHAELAEHYNNFVWMGQGGATREAYRLMEKVAPSRAPVLLLGEPGTGKSLAARLVHELSPRASRPFVRLHCGGWPEELLETELFGHDPGVFQGQAAPSPGRLEQASGGSLYLEGLPGLSLPLQAKLLRFMQDGSLERPGGVQSPPLDVRLIASSDYDLAQAVDQGRFREDLFYRLGVFPIPLSPLRERGGDLALYLDYFLELVERRRGRALDLSPAARDSLLAYSWPGNLREMANLLERLALLAPRPVVDLAELAPYLAEVPGRSDLSQEEPNLSRLEEMERREVMAALERNNWVQSHAARELGLTLRQIGYRIKKFGLATTIEQQRRRGAMPARRVRGQALHSLPTPMQPYGM
jgi:Nif-specific regulatory protein